jgi:hypothetical protein
VDGQSGKKANLDKSDSQPSLPGLFLAGMETQDCVLGYSQPSPSTSSHGTPGQAGRLCGTGLVKQTLEKTYLRG